MRRWAIVLAALVFVGTLAGCYSSKTPLIQIEGGGMSRTARVNFTRQFLQSAAEDKVITDKQYRELTARLDAMEAQRHDD